MSVELKCPWCNSDLTTVYRSGCDINELVRIPEAEEYIEVECSSCICLWKIHVLYRENYKYV